MIIRKAKQTDIPKLLKLWYKLMLFHRKKSSSSLDLSNDSDVKWLAWVKKWMRSPDGLVLIAQENKRIVGYSLNHIKANVKIYKLKKLGHMCDLYVETEYRKKCIASAFKKEVFAWFKKKKMEYASIAVHSINPQAHKIYKKWGFRDQHIEMRKKL